MAERRDPPLLLQARPPLAAGLAAAAVGVAVATAVLFGLRELAPVLSLGVVYLLVVLVVSAYWGFRLGLATAVVAALAFNYFHIPPTGRLTVDRAQDWVALGAFVVIAAAVSAISALATDRAIEAQQRREEADLAAGAARLLLGEPSLADGLAETAQRVAATFGLASAQLVLRTVGPEAGRTALELHDGQGAVVATLVVPDDLDAATEARLRTRVAPALEALLVAAVERERLQAEVVETAALRRSDDLKTAILRSVSHDLRSPLTAMVASGEALRSPNLDAEDRAALSDGIVVEGLRLERLIGKLLDLSRLEAGEAQPRPEWVDVPEVLAAARDGLARPELVTLQLDRGLPLLRADAVQLERAFGNLMENATVHGGGQPVSVRARVVGHRLVLRVVDRGPGIAAAEQARIFEAFYRAPGAAPASGSGLGLAIVRGFVEANGGTVRVESLPGQGTSFVVEFPVP